MEVSISARHCILPESIRRRAESRLLRLERIEPRLTSIHLAFDHDRGVTVAEARLYVAGGHTMVARGSGNGFRNALDRATDRLTRQLKRRNERRREHHAPRPAAAVPERRWQRA
ncbi:MAG: ribosome-associated translation inhibitor RaiA [Gemmatimonadetes bacterium]|nr:ribosome-associated translation inhibitor RaiA [Gemmatimonadota bacterium]